jgi:hypothetical protein
VGSISVAPGDWAQLVHDVRVQDGSLIYERPIQTGSNARTLPAIKVYDGCTISGWLEMRVRGEFVTNAKKGMLDPWLRATGWTCGAWAAGWPYTIANDDGESISVVYDSAGMISECLGGRGGMRYVYQPGGLVRCEFTIQFASMTKTASATGLLTVPVYATAAKAYMDVIPGICKNMGLWPGLGLESYGQIRAITVDPRIQTTAVPIVSTAATKVIRQLGCGPSVDQGVAVTFEVEAISEDGDQATYERHFTLSTAPIAADTLTITDAISNDVVLSFATLEVVRPPVRSVSGELIIETIECRVLGATTIAINP